LTGQEETLNQISLLKLVPAKDGNEKGLNMERTRF